MKNFKRALVTGLAVGAFLTGQTAHAAQADVTIDIDLPTVLIMYHFGTIDLSVSQAVLADFFTGGSTTTCSGDECESQGDVDLGAIADLGAATVTTTLSNTNPALAGSTTATVTVQNAVGVRAFGCSTYAVTVVDDSTDAGVDVDETSLSDIDGSGCSLSMTTGDLAFDLDFTSIVADPVSAIFDVTITTL
jgi:hypothetical protein